MFTNQPAEVVVSILSINAKPIMAGRTYQEELTSLLAAADAYLISRDLNMEERRAVFASASKRLTGQMAWCTGAYDCGMSYRRPE